MAFSIAVRSFMLCVAILGMTSLTFANISVLCFGSDGHVSIEVGSPNGCFHTGQNQQAEERSFLKSEKLNSSDNGCGSCTDVSASSKPIVQKITNADTADLANIALPPNNWLVFAGEWSIVKRDLPSVRQTAPPSAHLELLRSVIILS